MNGTQAFDLASPSRFPIFFDFGEEQALWWLLHKSSDGRAYVAPFSRTDFIQIHGGGATQMAHEFDELVKDLSKLVADYESRAALQPLQGFQQYLARGDKLRRRF